MPSSRHTENLLPSYNPATQPHESTEAVDSFCLQPYPPTRTLNQYHCQFTMSEPEPRSESSHARTAHALNAKQTSRPGPKPKPLYHRKAAQTGHFVPPVKRDRRWQTRKFKLEVPCYWRFDLVPDEDQSGERQVTWQGVCARHRVKRSTILEWKAKEDGILHPKKYGKL